MILNDKTIRLLIRDSRLVEGYVNLEKQIQPNGFDLTVKNIMEFEGPGQLDFSNADRVIPFAKPKQFSSNGWVNLQPGVYLVTTNEYVRIPKDMVALAFTRTSLLRMGGFTSHGVWDAGFEGRSQFLLYIRNPNGIRLKENARIAQMIFIKLNKEVENEYQGIYKKLV